MPTAKTPVTPGKRRVCRPWRTDPKTGVRIYARNYGLKAFCWEVEE